MVAMESVLERVLKEVPHSPHPSPFPKEELPFFEGPWFDIGRRAVEVLTETDDIKDFMGQYIQHIQDNYGLDREAAEKTAKRCVGYCTGYADDKQANRWFNTLSDISHPIMGRERPFRGGDNVGLYYVIGKSDDEEIRSYLAKTLAADLSEFGFKILDGNDTVAGRDNPSYFAIRLEPVSTQWIGNQGAYMLLAGFIQGIKRRMEGELGKSCNLGLETIGKK